MNWKLLRLIPNINLEEPYEFDSYAIVPWSDERYKSIRDRNQIGFFDKFKTWQGYNLQPTAMIHCVDGEIDSELAVNFRNILAVSHLLKSWTQKAAYPSGECNPLWSDYFDFYPIYLSGKEDKVSIESIEQTGMSYDTSGDSTFQNDPSLDMPGNVICSIDSIFYDLGKWLLSYHLRNPSVQTLGCLRAISVAYEAMRLPRQFLPKLEIGNNVALWVSAHEILIHHINKRSNCANVCNLLHQIAFTNDHLPKKTYLCKRSKKERDDCTFLEHIYCQLNHCRNTFLHGNPIPPNALYVNHDTGSFELYNLAPLVFRAAIVHIVRQMQCSASSLDTEFESCLQKVEEKISK